MSAVNGVHEHINMAFMHAVFIDDWQGVHQCKILLDVFLGRLEIPTGVSYTTMSAHIILFTSIGFYGDVPLFAVCSH